MRLDLEVVEQEVGRVGAVGSNAAHFGGRQHHHGRLVFGKPGRHSSSVEQIKLAVAGAKEAATLGRISIAGALQIALPAMPR